MNQGRVMTVVVVALSVINLAFCVVLSWDHIHLARSYPKASAREYSYVGNDYPRQWPIEPLDTVHMPLENSVHYNPQSETGHAEWSTLLPNNNTGIIHLGPTQQPFSISLFHHLRCLDILRVELYTQLDRAGQSPPTENEQSDLIHHCMGYIRQMLLCHSETRLESVKSISASSVSSWDITHTCKDWTAVFRAAKGTYESS